MKVAPVLSRVAPLPRTLAAAVLLFALLAGAEPVPRARAATLTVCSVGCQYTTIQAAINAAHDQDTISVAAGTYDEHLTLSGTARLTISGAGSAVTIVDGTHNGRVVYAPFGSGGITNALIGLTLRNGSDTSSQGGGGIFSDADGLTLSDVVLTGNFTNASGGALYNNSGTVSLTNVTIASDNTAALSGGGIDNTGGGTMTLTNVTVSSNIADVFGAGIFNEAGGILTLNNVTMSGNTNVDEGAGLFNAVNATATVTNATFSGNVTATFTAGFGGGMYNAGTMTLTNVTFNGNVASPSSPNSYGGAILNTGALSLSDVTMSGNSSATGGGISTSTPVSLKNTIVANNTGNAGANCNGTIASLGHNLSTDTTCFSSSATTGDQVVANPKLDTLRSNGGLTQTMALLPYSPAIDAGTCTDASGSTVATDQRGIARPQGKTCDVGAYEFVPPTLGLSPPTMTLTAGAGGTATATIGPSQTSDTLVTLSSANSAVASVPSSVTIPTGQTSATFTVTGVRPGGIVTITATLPAGLGSTSATLAVTVQARVYVPFVPNAAPGP